MTLTTAQRDNIIEDMVIFITASMKRWKGPRAITLERMTYYTDDCASLARAVLLRAGFLPDGDGDRWTTGGVFSKPLEEACVLDDLTDILDDHLPVTEDA